MIYLTAAPSVLKAMTVRNLCGTRQVIVFEAGRSPRPLQGVSISLS